MDALDYAAIGISVAWLAGFIGLAWLFFFHKPRDKMRPLESLPPKSNREGNTASDPENRPCPICLEVLKDPIIFACNHVFCRQCAERWLGEKASCPTCRKSVSWPCRMWMSIRIGLIILWTGVMMLILACVRFLPSFASEDLWWRLILLMIALATTVVSFTATLATAVQWVYTARETQSPLSL